MGSQGKCISIWSSRFLRTKSLDLRSARWWLHRLPANLGPPFARFASFRMRGPDAPVRFEPGDPLTRASIFRNKWRDPILSSCGCASHQPGRCSMATTGTRAGALLLLVAVAGCERSSDAESVATTATAAGASDADRGTLEEAREG
jgi:hypothetical protein